MSAVFSTLTGRNQAFFSYLVSHSHLLVIFDHIFHKAFRAEVKKKKNNRRQTHSTMLTPHENVLLQLGACYLSSSSFLLCVLSYIFWYYTAFTGEYLAHMFVI